MSSQKHICLVGFMGCGKSTVGRLLASRLKRPFIDLDDEVEQAAGRSIAQIFASQGEAAFRRLESQALKEAMARPQAVVALGGGAFSQAANREMVAQSGRSLWLQAPVDVLLQRAGGDASRPLAGDAQRFRALHRSRLSDYRRADLELDTQGLTPQQAAQEAQRLLGM